MKKTILASLVGLSLLAPQAYALSSGNKVGMAITNDTLGLNYATRYGKGETFTEVFYDQPKKDTYVGLGISSQTNQSAIRKPRFALMMKGYWASVKAADKEVLGLTLGAGYTHFFNTKVPLMAEGRAFYGPNILSVNASRYTELDVKLGYEIMPGSRAYLGYRKINIDVDSVGDQSLMGHVYLGIDLAL